MRKPLSLILAAGLVTATAASLHPGPAPVPEPGAGPVDSGPAVAAVRGQQRVELVFALDTTGSMSGMIDAAKRRIWSIATAIAEAQPAPELRIGLVAYRDRGDRYVTRRVPLTRDLDAVYAALAQLAAAGGGDGPESVNEALHEAVHAMRWSLEPGVYRTVFLVGDAPPHMDYDDDVPWMATLAAARERGIVVNTLLCGDDEAAALAWRAIAAGNQGHFLAVDSSGGALEIATPYDAELARLSAAMDRTRLWYGSEAIRQRNVAQAARERQLLAAAPASARADRAAYKATPAGAASLAAREDLVSAVLDGDVALEELEAEMLPAPLQALALDERQAAVRRLAAERERLRRQIEGLAAERRAWLDEARGDRPGAASSLDVQILDTLAEQAAARGLALGRPEAR